MLNNIEFKAYIKNTIAFARTIIIKCEAVAVHDNRLMEKHYGIKPGTDKAQWRYYLNLNGQYHITDEMMYVPSLDNGTIIEFTKANLDLNLATKRAYRLGGYYYTRLVEKYSHQLDLINGIINPIPQSESVPAKDYQILRYNEDYVLWNEYQLMPALQQHLDAMVLGSYKTEYVLTDNLMLPALLAQLHGSLISNILMLRKEADGTRYAHSFYIWSRLQSLGLSSVYKNVLDRKQTMWLYRNLGYVLRKLGRRQTFEEVMDIILTHRRIPLDRYDTIMTTEGMLETLEPEAMMISTPANLISEFGLTSRLWTVPEVIAKEVPLALDNGLNQIEGSDDTSYAITYGEFSEAPTKVLESSLTDTTERDPDRLMKVLHNEWIYLAAEGLYNINADITDVRTGKHFRLTIPQSVILWHYLIDRARGIKRPGKIPYYNYWNVRKIIPPTWQELSELGHKEILTETVCKDILNVHIDFPTLVSPDGFFNKSLEVFNGLWEHKKLYSRILNLFSAAQRENAVKACYANGICKINTVDTYEEFLTPLDLDYYDYNEEECLDQAWAIWSKVTGWEFNDVQSVSEQQRLLISLMKDLTSYTVQYIGSTESLGGEFNLPYDMLLDGDSWQPGGGTAVVHDNNLLFIPTHGHGIPEAKLVAKELTGELPGKNWGVVDAVSIGCGRIDLPMCLFIIEQPPQVSVNIINSAMTLREAENG